MSANVSGGATSPNGAGVKRKMNEAGYGPETVEQCGSTELEQETFSFLWSIKNYVAAATSNETECFWSPTFTGGPKSCHKWRMYLNARKKTEDTEYFAPYLNLVEFGDGDTTVGRKLKVRFQISLLNPDFCPLKQSGGKSLCEFEKGLSFGFSTLLPTIQITNPSLRFIVDDTLNIHCRVCIQGELRHRVRKGGVALKNHDAIKRRCFENLSDSLQELLDDSRFADLALSTPSKTFMVHKGILSARSSVFRAMLNSNMLESTQSSIEIPDFEEAVVKAMLNYIYTGETVDLGAEEVDIMQIAEKYDLGELKEECEWVIARNLSAGNAVEMLILAHLHNAIILKRKAMDFINKNKDEVKQTRAFQDLVKSNAAVLMDLYLHQ